MASRLVVTGRKCGKKFNIDKSKVIRVSRNNDSL
jgi:hypothetical protein